MTLRPTKSLNPALHELVVLLAARAVEDYLVEIARIDRQQQPNRPITAKREVQA